MEEEQGSTSFQPMERLLGDWLAGARLPEVLRVVQLIKAELSRRGVVLSWSISQVDVEGPCHRVVPSAPARNP